MKRIIILIFVISIFGSCNKEDKIEMNAFPSPLESLDFTWKYIYSNDYYMKNWIVDMELTDNKGIWAATMFNGIVKINETSNIEYNSGNSGLPNDTIYDIAIDKYNNLWVCTGNGLTKFDGVNWYVYNQSNSPLPVKHVSKIAIDKYNVKWIGCGNSKEGGLLCFNDTDWTLYTPENSVLPNGIIEDIHIDINDIMWIGTGWGIKESGLVRIEGSNWQVFDSENSGLPYSSVQYIDSDEKNNIWFGMSAVILLEFDYSHGSLARYNGKWEEHKPENSKQTSNRVSSLLVDHFGYVWIATSAELPYNYEVSMYDGKNWFVLSQIDEDFPHSYILAMKTDKENNIWISTKTGIIKLVPKYSTAQQL